MIKDPADLLEYLKVRREMAYNQRHTDKNTLMMDSHTRGMLYAFDETIKAVEAMINHQKEST